MAKNTSTAKGFEPGETNTRAVRPAGSGAVETKVAQTPQKDAKDAGAETAADTKAADTAGAGSRDTGGVKAPARPPKAVTPPKAARKTKGRRK